MWLGLDNWTTESLILLTYVRECFFLLVAPNWLYYMERDKNDRMDNKLFLNFGFIFNKAIIR